MRACAASRSAVGMHENSRCAALRSLRHRSMSARGVILAGEVEFPERSRLSGWRERVFAPCGAGDRLRFRALPGPLQRLRERDAAIAGDGSAFLAQEFDPLSRGEAAVEDGLFGA